MRRKSLKKPTLLLKKRSRALTVERSFGRFTDAATIRFQEEVGNLVSDAPLAARLNIKKKIFYQSHRISLH